jgi:16S rRNA (cytosine1402-N4)-methyltransferase
MMSKPHVPVLLQEVIKYLDPRSGKNFIDATLGFGGHAEKILEVIGLDGVLIGIDQDNDALEYARKRLEPHQGHFKPYLGNYTEISEAAQGVAITGGILADIGVSSYQLDKAERGFSFKEEGPLDMRMSKRNPLTAAEIVNEWEQDEITRLIREYGEERFASRIAKKIVEARTSKYIESTKDLAEIVRNATPRKFWPDRVDPATKTFQALRIVVNDELGVLREFLPKATELLEPGARLAVITFHSLEDRIVKEFMRQRAYPCTCPPEFPKCVCGKSADVILVTKKPITANEEEIAVNPRSRSAKLRVIEKIIQ